MLEDIASVLLALDMRQRITTSSFATKLACCAVACAATVGRGILCLVVETFDTPVHGGFHCFPGIIDVAL